MITCHPTLDESVEFLNGPADPSESVCELKVTLGPSEGLRGHVHPRQTESFEVLKGELLVVRAREARRLSPGETWRVPPGVTHRWENPTDEPTVFRASFDPPRRTREMFLSLHGIPAPAFHGGGTPGLMYAVLLGREYPDHIHLPGIPAELQRLVFGLLAPLARFLGYRVPPVGNRPEPRGVSSSTDPSTEDTHE